MEAEMKILGVYIGYDEPLWYLGPWEFGIFDQGWIIAKRRVIKLEGRWPNYKTIHPFR